MERAAFPLSHVQLPVHGKTGENEYITAIVDSDKTQPNVYGSRSRKKLAFCEALIGMAVEKAPVPSSTPVLFVVQVIGADRLVVLSQV